MTNTDPALRSFWHPVARACDIGSDPVRVRLLGDDWVLVRLPQPGGGSRLAAYADRCPHRLAPLSAGWVDGGVLRCGYHGWCFDADGMCTEIPAVGADGHRPPRADATVPAALTEHLGLVFLSPEPPMAPLLDVPEAGAEGFAHGALDVVEAGVGAGLMIDNFLDMSHFPFVHAETIGTGESAAVDNMVIDRDGLSMTGRSRHPFPNHEDPGVAAGVRPLVQQRELTYEYQAPFAGRLRIDYVEAGGTNVIELFVQPVDDTHSRIYCAIHRNDLEGDDSRLAECVAYERKILDEDLRLQERYTDHRLPLDLTTEVHVKADRLTVELRRILADLVDTAAETIDAE